MWGFLAKGAERQHGGNLGYDDEVPRYYSFDSTVANGRHVQPGDVVVLHDGVSVFGVATVEEIDIEDTVKQRFRCPECGMTKIKPRRSLVPVYRCYGCGAEFDRPSVETLPVRRYIARYAKSWAPAVGDVDLAKIRSYFVGRAVQHSIRELRKDVLDVLPNPLPT